LAVALCGLIARSAAVTAAAPMQRETIGLTFVPVAIAATVLAIRSLALRRILLLWLLWRLAACDERRQPIDVFVVMLLEVLLRPRLEILLLRLLRLEILLRLLLRIERLLLRRRRVGFAAHVRLIVALVVKRVIAAVHSTRLSRLLLLIIGRLVLPLVLLCGGDQAKIVFSVLIVTFRGNGIAGTLRIAGKLKILFGNMRGVTSDLHVRSVGLGNVGRWILVLVMVVATTFTAVATPHALIILTVSHDLLFHQPLFASRIVQLT
jgi:hypothetical protein